MIIQQVEKSAIRLQMLMREAVSFFSTSAAIRGDGEVVAAALVLSFASCFFS
jgi:hypothetical protein